jgi:hypothetical protein
MAKYIPKSQISHHTAQPGDNFVYTLSGNPYTGPYIQLSNGDTYAGGSLSSRRMMIQRKRTYEDDHHQPATNRNSLIYNILNKETDEFFRDVKQPISTKTRPTEEDYERGYYSRYFIKRINSLVDYKEISKEIYHSLRRKEGEYDHNLYQTGIIKWAVTGNVHKINTLNLKKSQKIFHFINNLFPIINEFQKTDLKIQSNLSTNGNELYYVDGTEYIGLYHIHPVMGPMEGATHTENEHKKLYYTNELPKIDGNEWEDFQNSLNPQGGCTQDVSCPPGYYWAGEPICGCTQSETPYAPQSQTSQNSQEIPLYQPATYQPATTSTTNTSVPSQPSGPAIPSSGGSGY